MTEGIDTHDDGLPLPHYRSTPRHSRLFDRFQESASAYRKRWWAHEKDGHDMGFDAEQLERLLDRARNCHAEDELDRCERFLEEVEQLLASGQTRSERLLDRLNECMTAQHQMWSACWEDGKQARQLEFDGTRFERIFNWVKYSHETYQLDRCERLIEEMEQMIAGKPGPLTAHLDFVEGLQKLAPPVQSWRYVDKDLDAMWDGIDDRATVDKHAERVRHRIMHELQWLREKFERIGGSSDRSQDIADIQREADAFAQGYEQLRQALQ
jgi:hypothetical protein